MANAVVAVFDEYNEAQSTVNELLGAGFNRNELKLTQEEASEVKDLTPRPQPGPGGVKGFFQNLFGIEEENDDIRLYDEAVKHGSYVVTAIARDEEKSEIATEVMTHHHPIDLDERSTAWFGDEGKLESNPLPSEEHRGLTEAQSIPVIQEEVKVGKREVQRGGVRIFQRVSEVPIEEELMLREERAVLVPVDKPATQAEVGAFREGSTELREPAGDEGYRSHWQQNYASQGGRYEDYAPAYEYGSTAATRYAGRSWDELEPTLRSDWQTKNPESKWERFKDSIKHAFSRRD